MISDHAVDRQIADLEKIVHLRAESGGAHQVLWELFDFADNKMANLLNYYALLMVVAALGRDNVRDSFAGEWLFIGSVCLIACGAILCVWYTRMPQPPRTAAAYERTPEALSQSLRRGVHRLIARRRAFWTAKYIAVLSSGFVLLDLVLPAL